MKAWILALLLMGAVLAAPVWSGQGKGKGHGEGAVSHRPDTNMDVNRHGEHGLGRYMYMREVARRTRAHLQEKLQEWAHYRQRCMDGNCEEYFMASKELVLAAIDTAVERLESMDYNGPLLDRLLEYRSTVEDINDINSLREVYPEIRETFREVNRMFFHEAFVNLIEAYKKVAERLGAQDILQELQELEGNLSEMEPREIAMELRIIRAKLLGLLR